MQELSLKGVQQILRSAYLIEECVLDLVNRILFKLIRSWGRFNKPGCNFNNISVLKQISKALLKIYFSILNVKRSEQYF